MSCSSDKEEQRPQSKATIIGTAWEETHFGTLIRLTFEDETKAKFTKSGKENYITLYKYTYTDPNIKFEPTEDGLVILYGEINGNILTITNPTITSGNQVIYNLYKTK